MIEGDRATANARILLTAKGIRAFADGFTALLLPAYLAGLGCSALQIGAITTLTLLGSAALTLAVGLLAHRAQGRTLLVGACGLMLATGVLAAVAPPFWPLAIVGFVGTLNPSGGDVSVFLPLEHALLAHSGADRDRTALFARYGLVGGLLTSLGALFVGLVEPAATLARIQTLHAMRAMFVLYGLMALLALLLYRQLPKVETDQAPRAPLGPSRRRVFVLAGLFSLDAFGGGFVVQSIMALWLFQRFGLSLAAAGAFFFWSGLLSAASQPAAAWISRRIGLVNTMVFTHVPANLCLVAAAFAPGLPAVIALLLVRSFLNQMDVPTRTSYVMAVVTPPERAAAAGVTSVPRSLAGALSPTLSGLLLQSAAFAWPLLIAGSLKVAYDLILLGMFRRVRPPEEQGTVG